MTAQTILPANTLSSGYDVDNSVRFNDGDSAYMHKTAAAGSRRIFTFSTWFKRGQLGTNQQLFNSYSAANAGGFGYIQFVATESGVIGDRISLEVYGTILLKTNQVLRDTSAWYHLVIAVDTTNGTANNRCRMYLNGTEITSFATRNNPDQNFDFAFNQNNVDMYLGSNNYGGNKGNYFDGYMAETVWIDGTQYAASDFGEFDSDSGIWKPIDVSGLTFGTNGFYLDFKDSSNLGNDANGGTDLTEVNLAATDQSTDTCTNNFATMNPLDPVQSDATYSEGNLKWATTTNGHYFWGRSTIGVSTGKWYAEFKATSIAEHSYVGIVNNGPEDNTTVIAGGGGAATTTGAYEWAYKTSNGQIYNTDGGSSYGNTYGDGAIIGVLLNLDDNEISFSKDGTVQNSGTAVSITAAASTPHGFYFLAVADGTSGTSATFEANFGSPPYSISSGNADANGHGNFEYAVPSGYLALCTKNLAENG